MRLATHASNRSSVICRFSRRQNSILQKPRINRVIGNWSTSLSTDSNRTTNRGSAEKGSRKLAYQIDASSTKPRPLFRKQYPLLCRFIFFRGVEDQSRALLYRAFCKNPRANGSAWSFMGCSIRAGSGCYSPVVGLGSGLQCSM